MRKNFSLHMAPIVAIIFGTTLFLSGCGGGGGGGGSGSGGEGFGGTTVEPLSFSGNTNPANVTTANAKFLVDNALGISSQASALSVEPGNPGPAAPAPALAAPLLYPSLKRAFYPANRERLNDTPINESYPCPVRGSFVVSGTVTDYGTGNLAVAFNNCNAGPYEMHGTSHMRIDAYDMGADIITDYTMSFDRMTYIDSTTDASMSGSIRFQVALQQSQSSLNVNMVIKDHLTQRLMKAENLLVEIKYDNIYNPTNITESLSGRVYDSIEGYVDISTTTPLVYAGLDQLYPGSGGPIILEGANNAQIIVTPVSQTQVSLEIDSDGDGESESYAVDEWMELPNAGSTSTGNTPPTANAGPNITTSPGQSVFLDGRASYDSDGDFIEFRWSLVSKPEGSLIALFLSYASIVRFSADVDGEYQISLTVNDGLSVSLPDTVVIRVSSSCLQSDRAVVVLPSTITSRQSEKYSCPSAP